MTRVRLLIVTREWAGPHVKQTKHCRACLPCAHTLYMERLTTPALYLWKTEVTFHTFPALGFCLLSLIIWAKRNDGGLLGSASEEQVFSFLCGSEALRCPLISRRCLARISTSIRPSLSTPKVIHSYSLLNSHFSPLRVQRMRFRTFFFTGHHFGIWSNCLHLY